VGLFFFADDYIKFIYSLREYLSMELEFIPLKDSKHKDSLKGYTCPIGKLGDVEIVFLHYHSKEEAKEKWERRCRRVNFDNLIFKFSEQNECSYHDLKAFDALSASKKFMFVTKNYGFESQIIYKEYYGKQAVLNDTIYFRKYIDLIKLIKGEPFKR
jgi:uncharacterized protein (DUF1919 family)